MYCRRAVYNPCLLLFPSCLCVVGSWLRNVNQLLQVRGEVHVRCVATPPLGTWSAKMSVGAFIFICGENVSCKGSEVNCLQTWTFCCLS